MKQSLPILLLGALCVLCGEICSADKPNIIFILADDLGYGEAGCFGQQKIRTPNIDKLASQGMRCTSAYAGSTVCAPSRCALMTGYHMGHARVRGNTPVPLRKYDVTIASLLKKNGYATALIGKWGLGEAGTSGIPNEQGFDYFFGYLNQTHAHNYYPDFLWRNAGKVALKNVVTQIGKTPGAGVATERREYSHDLFASEALAFIEKQKANPFFLYLPFTIPHANNEGRQDGMEVPNDEPYSREDWPQPQKNKAAMITRMDRDIGRIMDLLEKLDLAKNTVIFFSSDNGPHKEGGIDPTFFNASGPLRGIKRALYEGGIRVPMIVRWPGRIKAGSSTGVPWAFWDFLPTVCDITGIDAPKGIDGVSVLPLLSGREQTPHEMMYWEFHENGFLQCARWGNWKAVRLAPGNPLELYDLAKDIGETTNIADQHADIVQKLDTYMASARVDSDEFPIKKK